MDKVFMIAHIEKSLNFTVFDVKWIPCSAKFVVLGSKPKGTGVIQIYELNQENLENVKEIEKSAALKCGSFGSSSLRDSHLAVGDFTGRLTILDLDKPDTPVFNAEAHDGIINTIDGIGGVALNNGAPEIVTGGRDGTVKIWDPRQKGTPVACISPAKTGEGDIDLKTSRDCWTVAFGNSFNHCERYVAAGYDNGDIKLFDLRNMSAVWETNAKNGVCAIEFDRKDIAMNKMVVTTLEGGLHVYDMRTQHPTKGFASVSEKDAGRALGDNGCITGAKSTVWCVKHLPQNRDVFLTSGGAGSARVWLYDYPTKRVKESTDGHNQGVAGNIKMLHATSLSSQPVHCFDWSPDRMGLAVCGAFDQTVRVVVATNLNLY